MNRRRGIFLALEGIDGGGKTTQVGRLAKFLQERGLPVCTAIDPGGTAIGGQIRQLLLSPATTFGMTCEMLLYMASRAQLVAEIIAPALSRGDIVLCDRFLLSTLCYQGYGGGVSLDAIRAVGQVATDGIEPDWIGLLDLPAEVAKQRSGALADRIESRSREYFSRVREGFLTEARLSPKRISVLDAASDADAVEQRIREEVTCVLTRFGWT